MRTLVICFAIVSCCAGSSCTREAPVPDTAVDAGGNRVADQVRTEKPVDYDRLLASLPEPSAASFDAKTAIDFAKLSLACVDREYPNKPSHVVGSDDSVRPPRELHPAFFGCFDWHSAVHGHWAMVRLLKEFADFALERELRAALDRHLTEERIAAEIEYFRGEHAGLFERPYGWGWLLRLQAELATWDDVDARRWAATLAPLGAELAVRTREYLSKLSVPVRVGTHHSTAYALVHMYDYAFVVGDEQLKQVIERRSRDFYLADRDCPTAYEPSGEDFISPCLVEADLMRRVLAQDEFADWLYRFLPALDSAEYAPLRNPPDVRDLKDPKIGHLIGLSFQRAAAYQGISQALPIGDRCRIVFERLASNHRDHGLAKMWDSGYGGEHWLASFAIYLLTDAGPYGAR